MAKATSYDEVAVSRRSDDWEGKHGYGSYSELPSRVSMKTCFDRDAPDIV